MSKALVIKGANFSANKVETITISESVPCTGISLSQSSISATSLGVAATLTATVTPVNTTDQIVWDTSDPTVVTVSNGIITAVGVGSATITASCGTQTASCSVSVIVVIELDSAYHAEDGRKYSGSLNLTADPPHNNIGQASTTKGRLFYSVSQSGTYRAFANVDYAGQYLIPLPPNAKTAVVSLPSSLGSQTKHTQFVIGNSDEKQTYITGDNGEAALGIQHYLNYSITATQVTINMGTDAENANGFIVDWYLPSTSSTDVSTITEPTTITFS